MVNDMDFHTRAWYKVLNEDLGAGLSWEAVHREMYGKNEELLVRVFGRNRFSAGEMKRLSMAKEQLYQSSFLPHLALLPGLSAFLEQSARHHIALGIGSAAIRDNINFVIDNTGVRSLFASIVAAEDVEQSKPHPETFLKGAEQLGVAPGACIVFEDAPKGVEAARNAGMQAVVLTTMHEAEAFAAYDNVRFFISDYTDPALASLF